MKKRVRRLNNFCDIDEEFSSWEESRVVILSAPYEATTTYRRGTINGPKAIIAASSQVELYDQELGKETYKIGINSLRELKLAGFSPEEMIAGIEGAACRVFDAGKFPVLLGGEHTVSIGMAKAAKKNYPDLAVLQFDAHADLRNSYQGSPFNHACVARRLKELTPVVGIGIRNLSKEGAEFIEQSGMKLCFASEVIKNPGKVKEIIFGLKTNNIYLTIDLDVMDPSIMPAVGTPEPGGLGWYEICDLLSFVASTKKIVGFDAVELNPLGNEVRSDFLAAKLIYRLLGYIFN